MLKSMTGFGRGEGDTTLGKMVVESRSVNHRYSDINVKLPKRLNLFENRIKEIIRSQVSRGRIDVSLRLENFGEEKVQLSVDLDMAEQYYRVLDDLKQKLRLKDEITLSLLAGAKDLIVAKEELGDIEPYWQEILPVLKQSLKNMDDMKRLEGESLTRDLQQRLGNIAEQLELIKQQFPLRLRAFLTRLQDRLQTLLEGMESDPSRFQQEVAFLAERTDITEEIVRAESHLAQFKSLLEGNDPVGRKMDFLLQEIHREVNTVSAKANDAEISQRVVEIKSELEKIREQVQNVE
ncbi:MAG TPA: YicC/YloC family endoribonuclease [Thermodesulfobacteriota bacterium]|nr:YicC/YloC family endoribonuclease [Thermodesulfobacteriota bacterium]